MDLVQTSYVTESGPEFEEWCRVTVDTAPDAEKTDMTFGPCCENDNILDAMSCNTRWMI